MIIGVCALILSQYYPIGLAEKAISHQAKIMQEVKQRVKVYAKAAEAGDAEAAMMLGFMTLPKAGKNRNCSEPEYWFYLGMQGGEPVAALMLGVLYGLNPVISRSRGVIKGYWLLAASSPYPDISELAWALRKGADKAMDEGKFREFISDLLGNTEEETSPIVYRWVNELLNINCVI